jgi:hypothetical protein
MEGRYRKGEILHSVLIITRLSQFPAVANIFPLVHSAQTGSEADAAFYTVCTGVSLLREKADGA